MNPAPGDGSPWDKLSRVRPRLRPHAQVYRHVYRGEPWYIVRDSASARHFRLSEGAHDLVGRMDGNKTLGKLWEQVRAVRGEDAPTQEEVLDLIGRLQASDLLAIDLPADAGDLFARFEQARKQKWRSALMRPLSLKFPLFDPEKFLDSIAPLARPFFGRGFFLVWLAVVISAVVLAAVSWPKLMAHVSSRFMDPFNLILLVAAYPVIKAIHELGHALAIKIREGEVHEIGIMFLVFFPVPYVDASAASAFASKRQRMAVGAAGIMVELFLAALGVFLFMLVEPGAVRDVAFNVAVIGGVSTLLFNGNPLLKFDGYYVLADAIEIPNLAPRANRYWGYLAKRYLLGLSSAPSPVTAEGERGWFTVYGLAAFVYRLFIAFAIAFYVAETLPVVGLVLAVWALSAQLVYPFGKQIAYLIRAPELAGRRARGLSLAGGATAIVVVALTLIPVSSTTVAEGFVRLPEESLVRAGTGGFVRELLVPHGTRVNKGEPLIGLEDQELVTRNEILVLRMEELQASRDKVLMSDRVKAAILEDQIAELREEMTKLREDLDGLMVKSPSEGELIVPSAGDVNGRYVHKGDVLAYVRDLSDPVARVVVPQTRIDLIRRHTREVEVRVAGQPATTVPARILREVPSATGRLPSQALGTRGGGAIAVDAADQEGLTAIDPVFELDLVLPPGGPGRYVGSRVLVRFEHQAETLGRQWGRRLRQLLLSRLEF